MYRISGRKHENEPNETIDYIGVNHSPNQYDVKPLRDKLQSLTDYGYVISGVDILIDEEWQPYDYNEPTYEEHCDEARLRWFIGDQEWLANN
jgi:hypothetical protein